MSFEEALSYIFEKRIKASYISKNSTISFSTARRIVNSKNMPYEPQDETKLVLIELVKSYKEKVFLDLTEEEISEYN